MKKIILFLLILLTLLPVGAKTLTGGVVYTVETAREAAFEGIEYEISMEPFKKYMTDPGFISAAKSEGGKPRVSKKGRRVTWFSDGGYSVRYTNNIYCYYYNNNGILEMIGINDKIGNSFPYLSRQYLPNGSLLSVSLETGKNESYIFDTKKRLIAHWINEFGYNEKGELVKTRK